jgi:molybdopterin/thiamine biosynthesis adenylyltransferase
MELRAAAADLEQLRRAVFQGAPAEGAALLAVEPGDRHMLLRSYRVFQRHELVAGEHGELTIDEETELRELAALKKAGHAVVEVHTHPGSGSRAAFSSLDDAELPRFARYIRNKLGGRPFGALVFGEESYAGRFWQGAHSEPLHLVAIGEPWRLPPWQMPRRIEPSADVRKMNAAFDRQIRALGADGQRRLAGLRVAVVGLGGTGSQALQQLVHLGVRDFVLIEDDRVEASNLPRLAGAAWWDVTLRRPKTSVAQRTIRRIAPRAKVTRTGHLRSEKSLRELSRVDVIVGCVDNDGARLIIAELAASHLIAYLDLGVGIEEGTTRAMGGRLGFFLPGEACLACADEIDFGEAGEDLEAGGVREARIARGYSRDRGVEPALMPLNGVVVALGMIEFLAFATGFRRVRPFLRYHAIEQRLIPLNVARNPECPVCVPAHGMGDRQGVLRYARVENTKA